MKNIYKHIVLIAAALTCSTALMAQMQPGTGPKGVVFNKTSQEVGLNQYQIDIEAFVTGQTTQIVQEYHTPIDAILVLDVSASMKRNMDNDQDAPAGKSRMDFLKTAVNNFLETLANDSKLKSGEHHKVSIIKFAGQISNTVGNSTHQEQYGSNNWYECNYTQQVVALGEINGTNLNATKNKVNSIKEAGATRSDYGLQLANTVAQTETDTKRPVVVIMFTDGEPGDLGFTNQYNTWQSGGYPVGNAAIAESYKLKQKGYTVYSVGIFSDAKATADVNQYMNCVSSNYKNIQSGFTYKETKSGNNYNLTNIQRVTLPKADSDKYYFRTTSGSELNNIFQTIAEDSMDTDSDIQLTESTSSVIDIVSTNFVLPDNIKEDGTGITLKIAKCKSITGTEESPIYSFYEPVASPTTVQKTDYAGKVVKDKDGKTVYVCPNLKASVNKTNSEVDITGFDYSANAVGPVKDKDDKVIGYDGYKLIISFIVEINPDNPGGASVPTNAAGSGIYFNGEQIAEFQRPNVRIPNIVIVKQGLKKGESATFTITGKDEDNKDLTPITLVATCKADGKDAVARVKIQKPGRYTVTESTWSWAYSVSELVSSYTKDDSGTTTDATNRSITRNVNEDTEDSTYSGTPFIFKNSAKSGMPDHGESYKPNVFTIQQ